MAHYVWKVRHRETQPLIVLGNLAFVQKLRAMTDGVAVVIATRRARQQSSRVLERAKERRFRIRTHDAEKRDRKMLELAEVLGQFLQILVRVAVGADDETERKQQPVREAATNDLVHFADLVLALVHQFERLRVERLQAGVDITTARRGH